MSQQTPVPGRWGEEWFRALVGGSRDLLWVRDAQGTILYCSPAVESALGYRPDELEGRNERELIHPADLDVRAGFIGRLLSTGSSQPPFELRMRHDQGSTRWFETVDTNRLDDPAVRGIVTNARDVTDRKAAEDKLIELTLRDSLTGLPNRSLLMDRMVIALARTRRSGDMVAVLFCDLDDFKLVNDTLGHHVGDLALIEVAQRIERSVREGDTVARTAGDEFVVVCEGLQAHEDASEIAGHIRDAVEAPLALDGTEVAISVSIGIVTVEGVAARNAEPEMLLRHADAAMYRAKREGPGRWMHFDDTLIEEAARRLELEPDLRRAVDQGELTLHYQPIVHLEDGVIMGAEALLRWHHPSRGVVPPAQFISVAEETGLIVPIGRWVLHEACAQAMRWRRDIEWSGWMSVNLSARQVAQPGLASTIAETLTDTSLEPDSLWLELTETALLRTGHSATVELVAVEALGAHLGMDDFGTGYASLTNLQRLPIDFLKIDRSFVANLGRQRPDSSENAIVAAITQLGATLGLQTVAEGIETEEEADLLREYGCTFGQGFLLARPAPVLEITSLLAS